MQGTCLSHLFIYRLSSHWLEKCFRSSGWSPLWLSFELQPQSFSWVATGSHLSLQVEGSWRVKPTSIEEQSRAEAPWPTHAWSQPRCFIAMNNCILNSAQDLVPWLGCVSSTADKMKIPDNQVLGHYNLSSEWWGRRIRSPRQSTEFSCLEMWLKSKGVSEFGQD